MQNDKLPQQQKQSKENSSEHEDIWTSAFDSKNGTAASPPPLDIQASQLNNDEGGKVMQRQPENGGGTEKPLSIAQIEKDATAIYDILWSAFSDGADVATILAGKSIAHIKSVRRFYEVKYGRCLEQNMENLLTATNYRAAMVYLLPALTLMQRLQIQMNFSDDNESAMVHLIKAASNEERAQARGQGIQEFMFAQLSDLQLYESHKLVYPPAQFRPEHWKVAIQTIETADNLFWDDEDHVYMVIMDLDPEQRKSLYYRYQSKLDFISADKDQIRTLCLGTHTEMLKTTMDLATDGVGTYDNLAKKTVENASDKLARKAELEEKKKAGDNTVDAELNQIGAIDELVKPTYKNGKKIDPNSFLGDLEGDLSEEEYVNFSKSLGVSDFENAKRLILNAVGVTDDQRAIKDAFESIPAELRRSLLADPDVSKAIAKHSNVDEINALIGYVANDTYKIAEDKFLEIMNYWTYADSNYVELIQLLMEISKEDRERLVATYPEELANWTLETSINVELPRAVAQAAATGNVELTQILKSGGEGLGTEEELINAKLDRLAEKEYVELRMGYALVNGFQIPESIVPQPVQQAARHAYTKLIEELSGEMGIDEINTTTERFLKVPSLTELAQPGGIEMSMFILQQRVKDKIANREDNLLTDPLGWLSTNFIDTFSDSGGTADVAAMQALSIYNQGVQDGATSDADFAKMAAGYESFDGAYQDHVAACDTVTDVASTVAAIAAAMVVVVASYGTATEPAIAGLSAYLGGTSASTVVFAAAAAGAYKVTVSELIGQEHNSVQDEGGKQMALGGVDGALTALTAGIAKSLQLSFYAAIGIGSDAAALSTELSVGVIRGTEWSLGLMKKEALIHATRGTIDGIISGAIGNVVLTAADEATWRQGVWNTLSTFGVALLQGAALGGVTGGVVSGGMGAAVSKTPFAEVAKLEKFATKAGIDFDDLGKLAYERRRMVYDASSKIGAGKADDAEILIGKLRSEVGQDPATRIRKHLYVANAKPMAKPHIDAYMEQLIRIKGRVHGLVDQEWDDLQKCLNRDPASFQTLIARSDEELIYALRSAREETLDDAHGLSRHGPDVTDAKLERRVTQGYAPDDKTSPTSISTKFKSYKDFWETRLAALDAISNGYSSDRIPVDLNVGPGVNGNHATKIKYEIVLEHSSRTNLTEGFQGVGAPTMTSVPNLGSPGSKNVNLYSSTMQVGNGMNRTKTGIEWVAATATAPARWKVYQHIPWGMNFDGNTMSYTIAANHTI